LCWTAFGDFALKGEVIVNRLVILLLLVALCISFTGCSEMAKFSMRRNCDYMKDDLTRVVGLDQPSTLNSRHNHSMYAYQPHGAQN